MFEKLSSILLVLVGIVCVLAPAQAQDTIGLYADFGEGGAWSRSIIVKPGTCAPGWRFAGGVDRAGPPIASTLVEDEICVLLRSFSDGPDRCERPDRVFRRQGAHAPGRHRTISCIA